MFKHKNLRKMRQDREMSQKELAQLCEVDVRTISNWETGLTGPNMSQLDKIVTALNQPVDYFFKEIKYHV